MIIRHTIIPLRRLTPLLLVALLATGCASHPERDRETGQGADRLYADAREAMEIGDFEMAIQHLENLEVQYPFGPQALQAQLDIAYAYYRNNEPESAIATANRFIKMNPRHPNVDYAYYLRGLASFAQTGSALSRFLKRDLALRDPRSAEDAFRYFSDLVTRFPDSRYAADARQRMIYLRDYLARHELHVARYYVQRGAFVAAVNRASYILENFDRTSVIPEALQLLQRAYRALGMEDLAADVQAVIDLNHTPSPEAAATPG